MPPPQPVEEIPVRASGLELARGIREGRWTSVRVVEDHVARLRRVNPMLNAVVESRESLAMDEAQAADRRIADGGGPDLPPLCGVPCTIKESFAVEGMRQTSGLLRRQDFFAQSDATPVRRLRNAGAIVIGTTNVSELCMWMESANRVYGRTNNPYNHDHIVGGSSGGEGAIIGSGASPFGLGADIGGSIRMPAFFNGVFGHKPTGGLVPGTGQHPMAENEALRYLCTGPLARRAEDLMPLLRLLAGPDGEDSGCKEWNLGSTQDVDIGQLRVLNVRDNGRIKIDTELADAQERVAAALVARGAKVEEAAFEELRHSFDIWSSMLAMAGGHTFRDLLFGEGAKSMPAELGRWAVGRSEHTFPALFLAAAEGLTKVSRRRTREILAKGRRLREKLEDALGDDGIMLYPSYPTVAPRHGKPLFPPFQWVYTAILNVVEIPVTQVPLGLARNGLPLGVQVAARHGNDHLTIAVAKALEEDFGGWVPPVQRVGT